MDLADPHELRATLRRHKIRPARSLGQRFLVDRSVLSAILDAAELQADDDVLEVGPGPGVLTAALRDRARSETAVECDAPTFVLHVLELPEPPNLGNNPASPHQVD